MKIPIKTETEIDLMAEGGQKLARVLKKVLAAARVGVSLKELDQLAEALIKREGGQSSFKMVPGYSWTSCLNFNQGVVHGVPTNYRLQLGDLLSVDLGNFYRGFHTDMARTVVVGQKAKASAQEFLKAGQEALKRAIKLAQPGKRVGHLSQMIEGTLKKNNFFPVRELTGHGVGRKLHEAPSIPCFLSGKIKETPLLKWGMVLAIEVIYTQTRTSLQVEADGWTVETKDGSWGGLFENTVAVSSRGGVILTI